MDTTTRTIRIGEKNMARLEARYGKHDGRGGNKGKTPKEEMIRRLLDEADQMDIEEETE